MFWGVIPQIPACNPAWIRLLGTGCVCSPLLGAYRCCLSPPASMAFAFGAGLQVLLQSCWGVIVTGRYCDGLLLDIIDPLNPPHLSVAAETHPVAPVPGSPPVLPLSEVPQPLSVEPLGLALQQLDLAAPATLQVRITECSPPSASPSPLTWLCPSPLARPLPPSLLN